MAANLPLIWHQSIDGLCGAFLGIGAVVIGLRFYARRDQKASLKADDWIMIPCYVSYGPASVHTQHLTLKLW